MALTYTSATGTTSATIPSHAAGDLIFAFAYRDGSTTRPTIPAGQNWTALHDSNGANTNSHVVAVKTASGSSESTGTFTNASSLIVVVVKTDISGGILGYKNGAIGSGASTTLSFTGFTLDNPASSSRVMLFAGHRSVNTTIDQAPSGFTNVTSVLDATDEAAAHVSTSVVSTFSTTNQSVGGTSSGWRTHTLEVWDRAPNPIEMSIATNATNANVTSLGVEDYAVWTGATSSNTPNVKKDGGGALISDLTGIGASATLYTGNPRTISWTDGTPTASGSADGGVFFGSVASSGNNGKGFKFTLPAGTGTRSAKLFIEAYNCKASVKATLSDASYGPITVTGAQAGAYAVISYVVDVDFKAGSASQTVEFEVLTADEVDWGNVSIQAVWVSDEESSVVDVASNGSKHNHSSSQPDITTSTAVIANSAQHGHQSIASTLSITTTASVTVNDSVHGHAADNASNSTGTALEALGSQHSHNSDAVELVTESALTVNDAVHAQQSTASAIVAQSVIAVDSSVHAHTSTQSDVSTSQAVVVAESVHAHLSGESELEEIQIIVITANNAQNGHSAENVELSTTSYITVADSLHSHSSANASISVDGAVSVEDTEHGHIATESSLATITSTTVEVQSPQHGHVAEQIFISSATAVSVYDAIHAHASSQATPTESDVYSVEALNGIHGHIAGTAELSTVIELIVDSSVHGQLSQQVELNSISWILVNDAMHRQIADTLQIYIGVPTTMPPAGGRYTPRTATYERPASIQSSQRSLETFKDRPHAIQSNRRGNRAYNTRRG